MRHYVLTSLRKQLHTPAGNVLAGDCMLAS